MIKKYILSAIVMSIFGAGSVFPVEKKDSVQSNQTIQSASKVQTAPKVQKKNNFGLGKFFQRTGSLGLINSIVDSTIESLVLNLSVYLFSLGHVGIFDARTWITEIGLLGLLNLFKRYADEKEMYEWEYDIMSIMGLIK